MNGRINKKLLVEAFQIDWFDLNQIKMMVEASQLYMKYTISEGELQMSGMDFANLGKANDDDDEHKQKKWMN